MKKLLIFVLALVSTGWAQTSATGALTASAASCTSNGPSCANLTLSDPYTGTAGIDISGTFSATVQFEASFDGKKRDDSTKTWRSASVTPVASTTTVTSTTAGGAWRVAISGMTDFRVRCSAYTSGTVVVAINSSRQAASLNTGGSGTGTVGPGTANTLTKFLTATTVGDSGLTDDGSLITATEPFALGSTLNSVIPMQTAACPASGTAATVTWCADSGNIPAIEEGTGAKQYLALQPNVANDGATGTVLNGSAKVNSSGNAIACGTTDTVVPCYPVNSNTATTGQAQLIASGIASALFDATAVTAGDCVINSTTVANKFHDAGATCPTAVWIVGRATTSGSASTTQSLFVNGFFNAATGTVPTGTGFTHITGGAQDGAARAVDISTADVTGTLPATALPSPLKNFLLVNAQTGTSYTIVAGDCGKLVTFSNASATAITLPQATGSFVAPCQVYMRNLGAGVVTVTPTTSTIDGLTSMGLAQFQEVTAISDSTNWQTYTSGISVKNAALSVNTLQVQPSVTTVAVTEAVIGSDTNIGWTRKTKGTGSVTESPGSNSTSCWIAANATLTGILRVDCTNGRVGIGSSAPGNTFDIKGLTQWSSTGLQTLYNNITTAGQGLAVIQCITSQKNETTTADANVLTCTPASAAGTYRLNVVVSVSAATSGVIGWTATWTDSNGNAQTPTNLALTQTGTAAPALTFTTSAAGNYHGEAMVDVNNAGTAIVIKWTGGGTTTAKMTATIERII